MVTTCCVVNCPSRVSKNPNDEHVTFHCFPKNHQILKKWTFAIHPTDWNPTKSTRLCSLHFTADCYDTSGWSSRPKLKPDAVPTIFDFPALTKETVAPQSPPPDGNSIPSQPIDAIHKSPPIRNSIHSQPIDVVHDKSPPIQNVLHFLLDDAPAASAEEETDEPLQLFPEVIIEEPPPIKKARKCYLGDFNDMPNLSSDDLKSIDAIAKDLLAKKNKQVKLLKQKNRRLEKKISDLESFLENFITSRDS